MLGLAMGATMSSDDQTVRICGVPLEAFVKIEGLLGESHPPWTSVTRNSQ